MSNLLTKFPESNKLTQVVAHTAKNGRTIYAASFEDGTQQVIRTSNNEYVSVAQVKDGQGIGNTEFCFSRKPSPALSTRQQKWHIVTVQVHKSVFKENGKEPIITGKRLEIDWSGIQ